MNISDMNEQTTPAISGISFGARLQSAREALGLETKDAAAQLRLNERVILMLETDCYSSDIPPTFVRGYIRSYGKLLQIPEEEIKLALLPIQPQSSLQPVTVPKTNETPKVTSSHYFMQISTYLVVVTMASLVGMWWYSHSASTTVAENHIAVPAASSETKVAASSLMTVKSNVIAAVATLGAKTDQPPKAVASTISLPKSAPVVAKNEAPKAVVVTAAADDSEDSND